MKKLFAALMWIGLACAGRAQVDYTGGLYTQDFETLRADARYTAYTNLPPGWVISRGYYIWSSGDINTNYSNNYGTYCFAESPGAADKSLSLVIGTTGAASMGARFRNLSTSTFTSFTLQYAVEQWVKGNVSANNQTIPFSYSIGATSLTSGSYVPVPSLDMQSINDGDGTFARLVGDEPSNRQVVSATVHGITWAPNQDLWIKWTGVALPFFASHALALDDLTFSASPQLKVSWASPTSVRVSWSTNLAGLTLWSASTFPPSPWNAVTNKPVVLGPDFAVDLEVTAGQRFFHVH